MVTYEPWPGANLRKDTYGLGTAWVCTPWLTYRPETGYNFPSERRFTYNDNSFSPICQGKSEKILTIVRSHLRELVDPLGPEDSLHKAKPAHGFLLFGYIVDYAL